MTALAAFVAGAAGSAFMLGGASASRTVEAAPAPGGSSASRPFADLGAPVSIGNGDCAFGPALDRAFRGMILYEGTPPVARAGRIELGGRRMTPVLVATRDEGAARPGFQGYEASVRLSPAAAWNGLRLTRLHLRTGWEWSARALEFADRPPRVQAALRALGVAVPLPPGRRDIPTDACAISIAIEARPQGSALVCSSGC